MSTTKPTAVLGVSAQYHDAAAALVVDGRIVAAAHEERFTRVKGDASLPVNAIEYVLSAADLGPGALSAVVFYESPYAKADRLISTQLIGDPRGTRMFSHSIATWLPQKLWIVRQLAGLLGSDVPALMGDHHLSHASSAYYPSPFDDAAVLTVDGVGEWSTTAIFKAAGAAIDPVEHIEYPNSLGMLYSAFTLYCGFKINSGEYKLMGLAPYGTPRFKERIIENLVHQSSDGSFALNPEYFTYMHSPRTFNKRFETLLGAPSRRAEGDLTQHYADVAASIQSVTDDLMLGLARRAQEQTGSKNLCLAGGVALNVVSVAAIERAGIFEQIWVQPAAGDAGGSLGAALWASYHHFGVDRLVDPNDSMHGSLLGPTPSGIGPSTETVLSEYGLIAHRLDDSDLADAVAAEIEAGRIVAIARDRMEFGPRALGSRSILADARDASMQLRLNLSTKFREGFRPFAPIVLEEEADQYFETNGSLSPYMLKTYYVRPEHRLPLAGETSASFYKTAQEVRSTIPAVTHVDYSARVQTVAAHRHPFTHKVLSAFKTRTGCPVLINTSFNVRGEPIVASAVDAVECFLHADIDVLVLEDRIIRRSEQTASTLVPRRDSARKDD